MTTSRRRLLAGAAAGAGLLATTSACASAPATATSRAPGDPTFVLVGGAAAPSFFWTPLVRELALRGARALPVELPGHGLDAGFPASYQSPQDDAGFRVAPSPVAGLTLQQCGEAVIAAARRARAHGPVVLVGHSLGGAAITRAADLDPGVFGHLVYVSAVCAATLTNGIEVFAAPENSGSTGASIPQLGTDPLATGVARTNVRTADPTFLRAYRDTLMADVPPEQLLAAMNYLQQPDESVTYNLDDARGDPARWGTLPRTFVRLTQDRFLTPPVQDRMIADADARTPGNRFTVRDLAASHSGFIVTRAAEMAELLLEVPVTSDR